MSRRAFLFTVIFTIILLSTSILTSSSNPVDDKFATSSWSGGLIIDHTCIDLNSIPTEWIDAAQDNVTIHYAHTSHGGQVTTGLSRLESTNATFDASIGSGVLPTDEGVLCILDGNPPHSYITPELYWQGESARVITQNTIDNNPTLTVSLWSWCTQLNYYDEAGTQEYLDAMTTLETANPGITFVYMTSNAQEDGSTGYNRWVNNEMVRQYCLDNDKILFDFADLDCWSNGGQNTYAYDPGDGTLQIPIEHEDFNGNEAGHTTYTSCEQKGRAFWWLVAMLAGWNASNTTTTTTSGTSTGTTTTGTTTSTTGSGTATDQLPMYNILVFTGIALGVLLVVYVVVRKYHG